MKVLALILSVVLLTACSSGLDIKQIQEKQLGLNALIITIPQTQNKGFVFLDTPDNTRVSTIDEYWESGKYTLMFNGGYFDEDFSPSGFFKVNGKMIQETVSEKLSGFVALDKEGVLHVLARGENLEEYQSVIQSGPFVIDPGGQIGIKSQSERQAERTLVGITQDGSIVIVVTEPVTLYDLAHGIKKHLPTVERLLNLDGGPSSALKTSTHETLNKGPVRNYIALTKK